MQEGDTPTPSEATAWPDRQLQRKYDKRAADFGIVGRHTRPTAEQFKQALKDFVDQPDTLKPQGTYRGQPATFYTDPRYGKMVLVSPDGDHISGWTLNTDQGSNLRQRRSH